MSFSTCLPKDCVLERIQAMLHTEQTSYRYESYFPDDMVEEFTSQQQQQLNASWREKICQWSYNVVDHFDLPREVVAISLDLFDRYLATRSNECTGNMALLASLTTLHIAIKVHSEKNIKVATLASLSRGQFEPTHMEQMEWEVFRALGWKLHPPTLFAFISHLLMLFPADVHQSVRKELFEVAIYMAELSVCDSFFVSYPASTIALGAIINVMEDMPIHRLPLRSRDMFWNEISIHLTGFQVSRTQLQAARDRLRTMFINSGSLSAPSTPTPSHSTHEPTASPTSTTDMQVDETASTLTESNSFNKQQKRSHCASHEYTSKDHLRYTRSPTTSNSNMRYRSSFAASSPMNRRRSRMAVSPIVAGI